MGKTYKDRKDTRQEVVEYQKKYGKHPTRADEEGKPGHEKAEEGRRKPKISEVIYAFGEKALEAMQRGKSTK